MYRNKKNVSQSIQKADKTLMISTNFIFLNIVTRMLPKMGVKIMDIINSDSGKILTGELLIIYTNFF